MVAKYARINGKLCSVLTKLYRGDCVEIGTEIDAKLERGWINSVKTYKAKRNLRSWSLSDTATKIVCCLHCKPVPGEEVIGFKNSDGTIEVHKRDCPTAISRASQDGDSVVAVDFAPDASLYSVRLHLLADNRYHLLSEVINCITNRLKLSIEELHTQTDDCIVNCDIDFSVHSYDELQIAITSLNAIKGVDED